MSNYIARDSYLDFLNKWKHKDVIKVISGVRRAGKSTLLSMLQRELLREGVPAEHIVSINLESRLSSTGYESPLMIKTRKCH